MELVLQRPQRKESVKKYNILYVDDEPVNLRIFQHAFKRDYNVFTASNGFDALDILNEQKVDLIITDQQMPKMSGVDLLAKIVPKHPNIVRMIMTGFSDIGAIIRAVNEFGLDKYLVKPWDRDQLKVEFDKALEKKENEDKSGAQAGMSDSVIQLNDSILPRVDELQAIAKDSYLVYDYSVNNNYAYWFTDVDDKIVVSFFNSENNSTEAIGVKSYINVALSAIVYKSKKLEATEILKSLLEKVKSRYSKSAAGKLDISIAILDPKAKELTVSGLNQNVYYIDANEKLKMLNTGSEAFDLSSIPELKTITAKDVSEAYFISKPMTNQVVTEQGNDDGVPFLQFLRSLRGNEMEDQAKSISDKLSGEDSKCMIGIRV